MLVSCSDGEHVEGRRVDLAVEEPETLGALVGGVELDTCQAGQVAADVAGSEDFAGDPPVGEVVEDGFVFAASRTSGSRTARSASLAG